MPYNDLLIPWRLIPVDLPPAKHRWKKFLKKLYENGGNLQEPSGGSSQSTEGSPTPERLLKKNIMANGAENITVVVFNKGNNKPPETKKESSQKIKVSRKVRRTSNDVQSPDSTSSSRPSHSMDNLPSSYQRSNLTDRQEKTSSHDRLSYDRLSSHERSSHSRSKKSWHDERTSSRPETKSKHSEVSNPPLRPWFRSHDMVEDYGHSRHRPPEELPMQYRSPYSTNIRISLDSNSPRKVYDDSYVGPTRHRRHSDESKRSKLPYSRPHDARTPAQERLIRLEKNLKEERERKMLQEYSERDASGSDVEMKRRKSPSDTKVDKPVNGDELELDDEALCVWEVKAEEVDIKRNGLRVEDMYDRYYSKQDRISDGPSNSTNSPSSSGDSNQLKPSKPIIDSDHSNSSQRDSNKTSTSHTRNQHRDHNNGSDETSAVDKLKHFSDSLPNKRWRSNSPESMDVDVLESEIQELRKNGLVEYSGDSNSILSPISLNPNNFPMEDIIFVVIDTNVLCSDLIKNLKNVTLAGLDLVIYVPWQVLVELDALKSSNRNIAKKAQRACTLLNDRTNQSSGRLRSQPPNMHPVTVDSFKPESPDEYILLSALQLKTSGHSVILLTNDKNLMAKSEAAGVKHFTEISFNKIIKSSNHKSALVGLEKPPPKSGNPEHLMAHQLAIAFKNLLTSCMERLKELRGNLWVLYVPVLPPWCLLDAIKAARSSWDILCPDTSNHYKQLSLLNSIQHFFTDTSFDNMSMDKLHTLFDECCTLATSLPIHFTSFANSFISQAKEILDENLHGNDGSQVTPMISESDDLEELSSEERALNIIDQFDVFSQKLQTFCCYVYSIRGIKWPMEQPLPVINNNFSEEFIKTFIPFAVSTLETFISSLMRLSSEQIGQVNTETECVLAIHKCLTEFNGEMYTYSVKDVAAFANYPRVREHMDSGIVELRKLVDILSKIV